MSLYTVMKFPRLHFDRLRSELREAASRAHLLYWVSHRSAITMHLSNATYFYPNSQGHGKFILPSSRTVSMKPANGTGERSQI